jgi:hypothetical protein
MSLKKQRAKTARLYRQFGIDWKTSHKLARKGNGLHLSDLDPNKVRIYPTQAVWCYSCDCYHYDTDVVDKHGHYHLFRDDVLW